MTTDLVWSPDDVEIIKSIDEAHLANPYHDAKGRFASGEGAISVSVWGKKDSGELVLTRDQSVDWGESTFGGWLDSLSPSEKAGLDAYGGGGYGAINQSLRGQPINESSLNSIEKGGVTLDEAKLGVESALSKASLPEPLVVFRDFRKVPADIAALKAGDEFVDHGFMSTSLSRQRIVSGMLRDQRRGDDVVFEIHVPKGYQGGYISKRFGFENEQEILLRSNTRLRVDRQYRVPEGHVVVASVIP